MKLNYIRTTCCLILLSLSLINMGCSSSEKFYYTAPSVLPNTGRMMKTAGFWIGRHPDPDRVILDAKEILDFNRYVAQNLHLHNRSSLTAEDLKTELNKILKDFCQGEFYRFFGNSPGESFYQPIWRNMQIDQIPQELTPRYGFVVNYAYQRLLPTEEGLTVKKGDIDFDELQNSALDVGTEVTIWHQSLDGQWYYVDAPLTSGWVAVNNIALGDFDEKMRYERERSWVNVVVVSPKADIFVNEEMTNHYDHVRMGTRFPLVKKDTDKVKIKFPARHPDGSLYFLEGYMDLQDVSKGDLSYTPRTILQQAFKLINQPYGWGDLYGEQDCSRFLQEVFATVGIQLPRNSSAQAQVGIVEAEFSEETSLDQRRQMLLEKAVGGLTILPMRGHIMLYLGEVDSRPYAVHAAWAYREGHATGDVVRVINRVAVTDLMLGDGSEKGSLLQRMTKIVAVKN